jgi:peptide/nickel transport system permease protein
VGDSSRPSGSPAPTAGVVDVAAPPSAAEDRVSLASNWTLVWWRFRKHRLAMASAVVLLALYAVVLCPDFFSTQDP